MNWHPLYLFIYLFIKDDGLFGAEYVKMLNKYSISPDTRVPVKFVEARVVNEILVVEPAVKPTSILSFKRRTPLYTRYITRIKGETNQFVMKRFRQCHDLLHLLLDAPTNFEGESYVKAYEYHQTGFAVPLIGEVNSMENKSRI